MSQTDILEEMSQTFNRSAVALIPYKYLSLIHTETKHLRVCVVYPIGRGLTVKCNFNCLRACFSPCLRIDFVVVGGTGRSRLVGI